jgi:hypothetical protein
MSALSIQGRISNETLLLNRSECSTIRFYSLVYKFTLGSLYVALGSFISFELKRHDFGRLFRPVKFSVLISCCLINHVRKHLNLLTWTTALLHGL